jgi:integrase
MEKLQWDFHQMCLRNRDGSFSTRAARERTLDMCARQLREMGFRQMRAQSLKPKHVEALVSRWQAEGVAPGTMKNRMAHLRWWAEKVGRDSVIPVENAALGIPERSFRSEEGRQMALDLDRLVAIGDERVRLSLLLQAQFGLRREESIKFQPGYAIRGDELHLKASWTKGGRARVVPILTADQRWVLEQVANVAGKGSLVPVERTYAQHLRVYEGELRKAGISKAHGLRHAYAQRRYRELAGWPCPHAGGPKSKDLSPEQKTADREARLTVSAELGHAREEITAVYLGR